MPRALIGIDVGSASARAGVFDETGKLLATAKHPIRTWRETGEIVEQSSDDIWAACVATVRAAMQEAAMPAEAVAGIGFDATCSLVVLDPAGKPLAVGPSGDPQRNIIVWMDHRALEEARTINETKHPVLDYVGGIISPEMETPKLLWLSRHAPETYRAAGHFLDLADFLSFRATGDSTRSSCTLTCKWTYLAHENRWDDDYFRKIGLEALAVDDHARIGNRIVAPGTPIGQGLSEAAAAELGLRPGTPVAASLIDAHAGGVGTVGASAEAGERVDMFDRLAYIMGTSACIMATTPKPCFVPGVWGPYFSAMIPDLWLNEGGQSAAGAGIDHLVRSHQSFPAAAAEAKAAGLDVLALLEQKATARLSRPGEAALLARHLHVLPEYMGNRSPYADPGARAMIAGLDLETDLESLFVAGLCGLAYGLADVVDAMRAQGITCTTMVMSGGASRSPLVRQIMADTTGLKVAAPRTAEPVLLGAAMLGAVAAGVHGSLPRAMESMSRLGQLTAPTPPDLTAFHKAKRHVHGLMRKLDIEARGAVAG